MNRQKLSTIAIHVISWLIFLSLPLIFILAQSGNESLYYILSSPRYWLFFSAYIFLFYLHTWFLMPELLFKKRYVLYFSILVLLLAAIFFLKPFDQLYKLSARAPQREFIDQRPPGPPHENAPMFNLPPGERRPPKVDIVSIFLFITTIALSLTSGVAQQWRSVEKKVLEAEAEKARAELSFLKAQINPHFLFNTLNNIYTLAVTSSGFTAESVMKLSNIMRYVTDDTKEDYVSLQNEIDFISDYIDLHRLRLGNNTQVDFTITGDPENRMIAPLILMPFIENVFKYGISKQEQSRMTIAITIEKDTIALYCRNRIFPVTNGTERTGIGIENTKKRLTHIYPGNHTLTISKEDGFFNVRLTLQA